MKTDQLHTRMCCILLTTYLRHRQNTFKQSEFNSFNFDVKIKTPVTKLKDDNISVGNTLNFFIKI